MAPNAKVQTVIIGGGQAGLATSYYLKQHGHEHIVLEAAAQAANAWRNDRWDSFVLNSPTWASRLPGIDYADADPDGFLSRQEVVAAFERYIERFQLPVQYRTQVTAVESLPDESGYHIHAGEETLEAQHVVVATGLFQRPKIPAFSKGLPADITQLHTGRYRNPEALPPGAVLVVGSGQSGCQVAEELYQSGRKVYLCVSSTGRAPRRYRGKDLFHWLQMIGFFGRTPDMLPSPKAKFAANPQVTGINGGHTINLHQFARDGVVLLGRIQDGHDGRIWLAPDLKENLAKVDKFEAELIQKVDALIAQTGLDAPAESLPVLRDGYAAEEIATLDLAAAGITTIIWAMGYAFDFDIVKLPVFDGDGFPVQKRGITAYPGFYFIGLPYLHTMMSGLLLGVGEDAKYLACVITAWA
jgi:putative flavoprotein involved in K+ transport